MNEGKTYEMQWDCQFCGTKKLLGKTHRFCPNCGAPQNPDSRYYPADDEKVAVEDHVFVGVDVTCGSCAELNSGGAEFCQQCGAPLTDAAKAKTLDKETQGSAGQFVSSGSRDLVQEKFDSEMERVGVKEKPKRGGTNYKVLGIIGVIIAAIIGLVVVLNLTDSITVSAQSHSWERTVSVQEYRNFTTQSWRDSRPSGDNVSITGSCQRKQRGTDKVADGQTCKTVRKDQGDGTYKESQECTTKYKDVPVYGDWCTWSGRHWEDDYSRSTSGEGLSPEPYYENISLKCAGQNSLGCERASYSGKYMVAFSGNENRSYSCDFPQDEWASIAIESVWSMEVRKVDKNAGLCNTLERK